MAKSRKYVSSLVRALEQSDALAYLIQLGDGCQSILWANEGCLAWLGCSIEIASAASLKYTAGSPTEALHGLALPPDWFETQSKEIRSGTISKLDHPSRQPALASITAIPFFQADAKAQTYLVIFDESELESQQHDSAHTIHDPNRLHAALALNNSVSRFSLENLVGKSSAARNLIRKVQAASESRCNVLISGPPGSGREHVARSIANTSAAGDASNVISIHGSIADPVMIQEAMKSLLRSSESQSQTDEVLLLLDVDLLKPVAQNEMLGFLELPNFTARVLSTASENLEPINTDLVHAISTLQIELVSLAQRKEDLPLLAQQILESHNRNQTKQLSRFSEQAMEAICECDWPNNFDQLSATIQAATESASGSIIELSDFPDAFHQRINAQQSVKKPDESIDLDAYLLDIEKRLVERALDRSKGNKTAAASLLGISRAKLLRRLQQFNLTDAASDDDQLLDESVFEEAP